MTKYLSFALVASFIPSVLAHGWVSSVTVDGKVFRGPIPPDGDGSGTMPVTTTPIRSIATKGPVNVDGQACGSVSASPANQVIDVKPGDKMTFQWTDGAETWLHGVGPISFYIAKCGNTNGTNSSCENFSANDVANAEWFKIAQLGFKDEQKWFQADIQAGKPLTVQLPDGLAGEYLNVPAEIYPSCTQIRFSDSAPGKLVTSPTNGVKFPGAYKPDLSSNPGFQLSSNIVASAYVFPGPPLSNIAAGNEISLNSGTTNITGMNSNSTSGNGDASSASTSVGVSSSSAAGSLTSVPLGSIPTPIGKCKRRRFNAARPVN
ncbi:lytic polysaccharide monooxygenase [Sphaerobolus stellatus SS14]|uniref:lytic cellulose monooxygenase (C4-dehydrogenating) n=1 Tax=Sphaerobolus stellatus (strain SS14) TaxID=990650 RepID=A0A0C9U639_SPHS4|nr:lytic polysaccharide monooxygenase [Sphaerobolus stellatus SS14]